MTGRRARRKLARQARRPAQRLRRTAEGPASVRGAGGGIWRAHGQRPRPRYRRRPQAPKTARPSALSCPGSAPGTTPLDWARLGDDQPLYEADVDLSRPIGDYEAHLSAIRDTADPLPAELTGLLTELVRQLDDLAVEEALVVLIALADLRYVIAQTGQDAAYELAARDMPLKDLATALATIETAARTYLNCYLHP